MSAPPPTNEQVTALRGLVDTGAISAEQAAAVHGALWPAHAVAGRGNWLVELAGYLGSGLMIGGVALVLGARWDELSRTTKVSMLAAFAVAFVVAAVIVAGGPGSVRRLAGGPATPRRRVVGALLALASVPVAFAVTAAFDSPVNGPYVDRHSETWGALAGLVVSVAALAVLCTALGVVITGVMSVAALIAVAGDLHPTSLGIGAMLLGLGVAWVLVSLLRWVTPRPLGLAIGAALAIVGAQVPLDGDRAWSYALTAAVALASFTLYHRAREIVLLVSGVVASTLVAPEIVADVSGGAVEGAMILLVGGAALVAASAIGLRLRRAAPPADEPLPEPAVVAEPAAVAESPRADDGPSAPNG